jgi:hypothetical protein
MFTVKVIDLYGNEDIFAAVGLRATAKEQLTHDAPPTIEKVSFQTPNGLVEFSGEGATIYVMNDNGKTVSKYFFSKFPEEVTGN